MKILIVVDMQNDFIDGVLGTPEAQAIVPNVSTKIKAYLNNKDTVIYTRDTHDSKYLETQEGKRLPCPHCVNKTRGWEIADGLYEKGCMIVDKPSFGSTWLPNYIMSNYRDLIDSIEIVGLCTDICVISNAMILKAYFPEIPISVDGSCCAGVTPEGHNNALEAMKMCQIDIV